MMYLCCYLWTNKYLNMKQ